MRVRNWEREGGTRRCLPVGKRSASWQPFEDEVFRLRGSKEEQVALSVELREGGRAHQRREFDVRLCLDDLGGGSASATTLAQLKSTHTSLTAMRTSQILRKTVPIPLSDIPSALLRLPPKPSLALKASSTTSPTIDRLIKSLATKRRTPSGLAGSGRGLGNLVGAAVEDAETDIAVESLLPPNLRIEEFVPKKKEYAGVRSSHRELVRWRYSEEWLRARTDALFACSCRSFGGRVKLGGEMGGCNDFSGIPRRRREVKEAGEELPREERTS